MNDKILTLLGFARKAGKLSFGFDGTVASVKLAKAKAVLLCKDLSEKTKKEITFHCNKYGVLTYQTDYSMEQISSAIGKKCGVLSVNDAVFSKPIAEMLQSKEEM